MKVKLLCIIATHGLIVIGAADVAIAAQ